MDAEIDAGVLDASPDALLPCSNLELAFVSDRDGDFEIYRVDPSTGALMNLTQNPALDDSPTWSPDGERIAFVSTRDANRGHVFVMNADGSNPVDLTLEASGGVHPDWSPDSTRLAYGSRAGDEGIIVIDVESGVRKPISGDIRAARTPRWAPDGGVVAFHGRTAEGVPRIYVADPDGFSQTPITDDTVWPIEGFDWSPDGSQIVFTAEDPNDRGAPWQLYIANADGTGFVPLATNVYFNGQPIWSPDGSAIAFAGRAQAGMSELFVLDLAGTEAVNVSNTTSSEEDLPAWSPDGTYLTFTTNRDGDLEVYTMRPDGSQPTNLSQSAGMDAFGVFSPCLD